MSTLFIRILTLTELVLSSRKRKKWLCWPVTDLHSPRGILNWCRQCQSWTPTIVPKNCGECGNAFPDYQAEWLQLRDQYPTRFIQEHKSHFGLTLPPFSN